MSDTNFDVVVIGGGPGGYVAAIRAAKLGLKTACIEKEPVYGGTCLRVGCIPSKALLDSSEHYSHAVHGMEKHGVMMDGVRLDLGAMMKRKDGVVKALTQGVGGLLKKKKVATFNGHGSLIGASGEYKLIRVKGPAGAQDIQAKNVILATGSEPVNLPFMPFDGQNIVSSTGALSFSEVPKHLVVVGGGVIGLELGSVWARLGSKVTVVEFQDKILGGMDSQMSKELQKILTKQGLEFRLSCKCLGAKQEGGAILLDVEDMAGGSKFVLEADKVLVSTGRKPYTDSLGLETVGLSTDDRGRIPVNVHLQTSVQGIYAIGDVVAGPMLAHKAEEEGVACAEFIATGHGHVNYDVIPGVVYTWPEFASVGRTEDELKAAGVAYKAGKFPFIANGRAKAMDEMDGMVKILADATTDKVLGMHILGPRASDLIAEGAAVMEFGGSAEDIARTCHAHPTLPEAVKEAAMNVDKWQIHI